MFNQGGLPSSLYQKLPFHGKYVFKGGHMDMTFPSNEQMRYYLVITTEQCLQVLNRPTI